MIKPNDALIHFHMEHCKDLPITSPQVFYELLKELQKLKEIET